MKTPKGIYVDIIDVKTGQKPLEFETDDTVFVRMSGYGDYKVRILSPELTEVVVTQDGAEVLNTRVPARQLTLLTREDGSALRFADPARAGDASPPSGDGPVQQTLFEIAQPAAPKPATNGLVVVSVRFADQPGSRGKPPVAGHRAHHCAFQLNTPRGHAQATADNLHRIIPAEGPTRRRCSCCQ